MNIDREIAKQEYQKECYPRQKDSQIDQKQDIADYKKLEIKIFEIIPEIIEN